MDLEVTKMPHINRVRLVNVNYNDAKSLYDDFLMEFNGKAATYDLVNGGGKSVLLLMMLQNVIPNVYLKSDRPVKNIFLGGNPRRTSHSLIEWILDDDSEYKYMLTGFCARRRNSADETEEVDSRLEVEYFNYCYLYNSYNENDIKHLPLMEKHNDESIVMSYEKLRQYLTEMKRRGEAVETFYTKRTYQSYIEQFGLIEAEWKLIAEMNESENHIAEYFKTNKTSRKLIENFLIKIIDNINLQNTKQNDAEALTDTLIQLKDNLIKFKKQSDNRKEYEEVSAIFSNINEKNKKLKEEFGKKDELDKKAYESYEYFNHELKELNGKTQDDIERLNAIANELEELGRDNKRLDIYENKNKVKKLEEEISHLKEEGDKLQKEIDELEEKYKLAKAQNEYMEYKENCNKITEKKKQIEIITAESGGKEEEYKKYGYNYKLLLQEKLQELNRREEELEKKFKNVTIEMEKVKDDIKINRDGIANLKAKMDALKEDAENKNVELEELKQGFVSNGELEVLMNVDEGIKACEKALEESRTSLEDTKKKALDLAENINKAEKEIIQNEGNIKLYCQNYQNEEAVYNKYLENKESVESLTKTFGVENLDALLEKLETEKNAITKNKNQEQIVLEQKNRKIELIEKYHIDIPNEDIINLKNNLEKHANYVTTGIEELKKLNKEKQEQIMAQIPIIVYSVLVDSATFEKIRNNKTIKIETENLVPIINIDILREEDYSSLSASNNKNIVYSFKEEVYQHLEGKKLDDYLQKLKEDVEKVKLTIQKIQDEEDRISGYMQEVAEFKRTYIKEVVDKMIATLESIKSKIEGFEKKNKELSKQIEDGKEQISSMNTLAEELKDKIKQIEDKISNCEQIKKLSDELKTINSKLSGMQKELEALEEIREEKEETMAELEQKISSMQNEKLNNEITHREYNDKLKLLPEFAKTDAVNKEFEEIESTYRALEKARNSSNSEIQVLEESIQAYEDAKRKNETIIIENGHNIQEFLEKENVIPVSQTVIKEMEESKKFKANQLTTVRQNESKSNLEAEGQRANINLLQEQLQEVVEGETSQEEIYHKREENKNKEMVLNKERQEIKNKIGNAEKRINELTKEVDRLEIYITTNDIKKWEVNVNELLENELYKSDRITKEASVVRKTIENAKINFERFVQTIEEQIKDYYIKQDVLDTLHQLNIPVDSDECNNIENSINEVIENIKLKIDNIDVILKDLAEYQQKFVTKCYEKAETVVNDLKKLPNLSRIKINGKKVNMIKLDLYEYEKEEKENRIKSYIDSIVQELEKNSEEIKREEISEKLSSRALVSQIVNMDRASVKLYKIEDIEENSAYKNWDGDLGSDGQINAFYFMFAVCIISYISMLTRGESKNDGRKVIIADNPFGATSAVYLWNAMFDILKENNVQLIAPGHNISKELVSKFEVNYVLKQEVFNQNKKVVKIEKEILANQDEEYMGMDYLEMEQQSLF